MPRRQHAGVNPSAPTRLPSWLPAAGLLLALVVLVWVSLAAIRASRLTASTQPAFNPLVHWREAGRDWLLVADGEADQLTVYSAADGRRLRRVKVEHGLRDSAPLIRRDGQLYVVDDAGELDEVRLSSRPQVAANLR